MFTLEYTISNKQRYTGIKRSWIKIILSLCSNYILSDSDVNLQSPALCNIQTTASLKWSKSVMVTVSVSATSSS